MTRLLPAAALALGLFLVTISAPLVAQQSQAPTFRSGVDVVQLDVSVLDENRQPVKGLTAEDFTITERGQTQPIVSFGAIDLPGRPVGGASWLREIGPDVTNNHHETQRVVIILMDDFYTPLDANVMSRTIAETVIDHLGPADLAAVVFTLGRRQGQEFTTDRTRLRAAANRFIASGIGDRTPAFFPPPPGRPDPMRESGACFGGKCVQDAVRNSAAILTEWPGWRKTLVFISPYTPLFRADLVETAANISDWSIVFKSAQQANLNLYQYDPRGLEVGLRIEEDLGTLADATGGRTVQRTNAPWEGVPQMFRENSSYYMLGFQPTNGARDGRFRSIDVRVNRPGLTVRTRSGYYAPRDERPPRRSNRPEPSAMDRAIGAALPTGDLPLSLTVAPFAVAGSQNGTVAVVTGFTALGDPQARGQVEILATAFRDDWKSMGAVTQKVELPSRSPNGGSPHVDLASRLELPPGRYEIRTAVTNVATGSTGSAFASVVVPDFRRENLSLSGLVLQRQSAGLAGSADAIDDVVPLVPTTIREFDTADTVAAYLQVIQAERGTPSPVVVRMTMVDEDDAVRFARELTVSAEQFRTARIADVQFDVPLTNLPEGAYLLTVEASSTRGSAKRHLRLSVR